jgi:hypothetical protein
VRSRAPLTVLRAPASARQSAPRVVFPSSACTGTNSSAGIAEADVVTSTLVKLLRLISIGVCVVVAASFVTFAVEQTKTASGHQQEELATPAEAAAAAATPPAKSHESSVRKGLDEASAELTSPFAGLVSGSSEWATRGVKLLLALLIYGFGIGYLARMVRVRV